MTSTVKSSVGCIAYESHYVCVFVVNIDGIKNKSLMMVNVLIHVSATLVNCT